MDQTERILFALIMAVIALEGMAFVVLIPLARRARLVEAAADGRRRAAR